MVAKQRSAEELVAELDRIINQYRTAEPRSARMTRTQAIERVVELGFSEGDAVRYLDWNHAKPAVSW